MSVAGISSVKDNDPVETWQTLSKNSNSALVDCRTKFEWDAIGTPDLNELGKPLHLVEWRSQPDMQQNPEFASELDEALDGTYPKQLFFVCRSGARSFEAATYVQNLLSSRSIDCECINVAEGFEGDPGPDGQRGKVNGWKARNLPWQQG